MEFVVEDGTGVPGANAYITEDYLWAYAPFAATAPGSGDPRAAIVRASAWIDATYGARFPGYRVNGREQGLAWPRTGGYDITGEIIADDAVPPEVMRATAEAALRELASAGSLMPDRTSSPQVRSKRLGSMEIEYAVGDSQRAPAPDFPAIRGILAPLIGGVGVGGAMVTLLRA